MNWEKDFYCYTMGQMESTLIIIEVIPFNPSFFPQAEKLYTPWG